MPWSFLSLIPIQEHDKYPEKSTLIENRFCYHKYPVPCAELPETALLIGFLNPPSGVLQNNSLD
jgi:hypothetical protein